MTAVDLLAEAADVDVHRVRQRIMPVAPHLLLSLVNIKPVERNRFAVEDVEPDPWAVRILPPLDVRKREIDLALEILDRVLAEVRA